MQVRPGDQRVSYSRLTASMRQAWNRLLGSTAKSLFHFIREKYYFKYLQVFHSYPLKRLKATRRLPSTKGPVAKVHSGGRSGETIGYGRKSPCLARFQRRPVATVVKSTPVAQPTETISHGRPKSTPVARLRRRSLATIAKNPLRWHRCVDQSGKGPPL
jgi:hypothetical protein